LILPFIITIISASDCSLENSNICACFLVSQNANVLKNLV